MSNSTGYAHIEERADSKMWLIGTQTKVIEVALDRIAHHWDADEIQRQHPHLALGQIYSCLAYYCDHQEKMDATIEEQLQTIKRLRGQQGESALQEKLGRVMAQRNASTVVKVLVAVAALATIIGLLIPAT